MRTADDDAAVEATPTWTILRRATARSSPMEPDWLVQRPLSRDVVRALSAHARGGLLDVGCGMRPYEALAPRGVRYLGLDGGQGAATRPDVCGAAASLPFAAASFDTVLCTQVIEHVPDPAEAIREIARVLRPGGRLILSAPQAWFLHEEPHDYTRFTRFGLGSLCRQAGLVPLELKAQGGFWAMAGIFLFVHAGSYVRWAAERRVPASPRPGGVPRWRRLLWPLRLPMAVANVIFAALDAIPQPGIFALNHLVVAEKRPTPGAP